MHITLRAKNFSHRYGEFFHLLTVHHARARIKRLRHFPPSPGL